MRIFSWSLSICRYYTNQVHEASFVLPRFVQKEVEKAIGEKSGEGKV